MNNNNNEKYKAQDRGPFVVFAERTDKSPLSDIALGRILKSANLLSTRILSISGIKNNCVKIKCENYMTANKLISSTDTLNINITIPDSHLYSEGVVNNIDTDLNIKEITENITCSGKIHKIERLQRWNFNSKTLEPTKSIKITFREYMLPEKVRLYCVPLKVFYFVPQPLFCKLCKRFGHFKKYCKKPNTCAKCLEEHPDTTCSSLEKKCRYCPEATHFTGQRECPETKLQYEIKKTMTINRIGYKEAKKNIMERTHTRSYKNKFDLKNPMEFPTMTPNTTKAQELIGEWQNPLSDRNKFDNLIKRNCCKSCVTRIPYATLIATIMCLIGVVVFCGTMYRGTSLTVIMLDRVFNLRFLWIEAIQMIFIIIGASMGALGIMILFVGFLATGATRYKVYRAWRARVGGRISCAVCMTITYILNILWILTLCFLAILTFVFTVFWHMCSSPDVQNHKVSIDFTQFYFLFPDHVPQERLKITEEFEVKAFCKDCVETAEVMFILASVSCFLIILSLVHYLMCLSANYAHIRDHEKFQELQEIQNLTEMEYSAASKDRF